MENSSSELTKLFVGGIDDAMTEEEIGDYFSKFGEVKEVVIVKERGTGKCRGFGFVEFLDTNSVEAALREEGEKVIAGKKVEVKRARPRNEQRRNYQSAQHQSPIISPHENTGLSNNAGNSHFNNGYLTTKIFVGGLASSITEDEFRSYFEKFGRITDVVIMYDKATGNPRGFGFITFDSEEAVDNVLKNNYHHLSNRSVEVKRAVPKVGNNPNIYNSYNHSNHGSSMVGGTGSFEDHQNGHYPSYGSGNGFYPAYAPPVSGGYYGTTAFGGGYGYGGMGYGGMGYGAPCSRAAFNGPWMARRNMPYGATMYPYYPGIGSGYIADGGYHGGVWPGNGKLNQGGDNVQTTEDTTTTDVESVKLDDQQTS